MTKDNPSLDTLRAEIDRIDDQLHDLLMERAALVDRIAMTKVLHDSVPLRPGREATILRRLIARHSGRFPRISLVRIWREIISASTGLQKPSSIGVCQPERGAGYIDLARNHFGLSWPVLTHGSPGHIVRQVADGDVSVGVVPFPTENDVEPWWLPLASGAENLPRIVTRLPMIPTGQAEPLEAFVIARRPHEQTDDDRTLIVAETVPDVSRDRMRGLVATAGLEATAMMATRRGDSSWLHLIEITGFATAETPELAALAKDPVLHVSVIGGYAVPLTA